MPKLIMMSAPSASGKSTMTKKLLEQDGNAVRVNRDDLRLMSILKWTGRREKWIIAAEMGLCATAARMGLNIIVDDTNLLPADEDRWKNVAKQLKYDFQKIKLDVPLETCIWRDSQRPGIARLGRPTIERQFLRAGLWKVPDGVDVWIWDIDGTLADLTHRVPWITLGAPCPEEACDKGFIKVTIKDYDYLESKPIYITKPCPYCVNGVLQKKQHDRFYELVPLDTPIDIVVRWIKSVYDEIDAEGNRKNYVLVVSGRSPEKCGEETVTWLEDHGIRYDHLIMRRSNMHGFDHIEKQLILDMILKIIPKERIKYVVDDRPSVVAMWKRNGLHVIPVRGRDDDKFYNDMDQAEKDWPGQNDPDMAPCSGDNCDCNKLPANEGRYRTPVVQRGRVNNPFQKPKFQRPLGSYIKQGVVKLRRWWAR